MLIPKLKAMIPRFEGKLYKNPGHYNMRTNEGVPAVKEAIKFLETQKSVPALTWDDGLQKAARDHVKDQGPKGLIGHGGTDGSNPQKRMARYTTFKGPSGENIMYGINDPERSIESLIIDDGVASRGHRKNIFNSGFKSTGIFTGDHKKYGVSTVIDYNGSD